MKLIVLLTHGLGDWYPPLSILPAFMQENNISNIEIYVDSIYFNRNTYKPQQDTGIRMIESVTKNWKPVPQEYFGSDDWYGIPDRRLGPQYKDIRYDFVFYRKQALKDYMRRILQCQTEPYRFICGTGVWSYEWNGTENIPLDFSKRNPLYLGEPTDKKLLDKIIESNMIIIHLRKKGVTVTDEYFNALISYCHSQGKDVIFIGLKHEVNITTEIQHDLDKREIMPPEDIFYLIENNRYMITSSSVYTHHRFFSNLPTVITIMEHNVDRWNAFHKDDVENKNYLFLDADVPHLTEIKEWLLNV